MAAPPDDLLADFARESLYTSGGWFVHRVLDIDPDANRVVAEMDTRALPLVAAQRELPGHPRHVPAAVAIQSTGTLGQLFAVYVLGLRVTEGWSGFGTHIHEARWGRMGEIGPPLQLTCTATRIRRLWGTTFCDFAFDYRQGGEKVYTSRQTAAWRRIADDAV